MKFKNITKEQILISLDRLTRFKNTKDKYLRVFIDIISSNLLEPKLKKQDIELLDYSEISNCVSKIFNQVLGNTGNNLSINEYLYKYENGIFKNSIKTQELLKNEINYSKAIELIPEDAPINLKWLKEVGKNLNSKISINDKLVREEKSLKFPIEKVVLVEGITEEILLPAFSNFINSDFYKMGIQIYPAGGKNQVVKKYYELSENLRIPIFILLDKDAEENINQILPKLRSIDKIHLVSCGEFEDLLPKSLIIKTVNNHFKNFLTISDVDFVQNESTVEILEEIFKKKGLHEFKKAEFAKLVKENISEISDISKEIQLIIEEITLQNKMLDSKICSC